MGDIITSLVTQPAKSKTIFSILVFISPFRVDSSSVFPAHNPVVPKDNPQFALPRSFRLEIASMATVLTNRSRADKRRDQSIIG